MKTLSILAGLALVFSSCSEKKEETRPNILVVLCDDLGYADVGFNGAKDIQTPSIDLLAKNGVIFTDAYVSHGFCGPSRASLMTGIYAHSIGAQFNLPPNSEVIAEGIDADKPFVSKVLQDAGYYTGAIGKWHLGAVEKYHPNNRGFDEFYGFLGGGHNYFPEQFTAEYNKRKEAGNEVIWDYLCPLEYNGEKVVETEYLTDAFSREAVKFVNKVAKTEEPFFLYLAYNAPHSPMEAKEEDLAKYSHIKDKKRRTYAAMVHAVDRGVNEVVEALKESNQYENTLIVFLSDNGGKLKLGADNTPLKEGKGSTYEGGYRVPMMFHWPKAIAKEQVFEYPVSAIDYFATFASLAGAEIPTGAATDSENMWDNIIAGTNPNEEQMIYCLRHRTGYSDVGARKNEWKVTRVGMQPWKLFKIKDDPSESNDLSAQYPDRVEEMVKETEQWSKTHIQPKWFHDEPTGVTWRELGMPKYDETFSLKE